MPYYRLFYHFVWATKQREALITNQNRAALYAAVSDKVLELHGIVQAIGGMSDHLHLVATVPPSISISSFIGQIKGSSSHLASHLQPIGYEPFAWQPEYGVISVTEAHLPIVVRYVLNQAEHHYKKTLKQKLENFE